MTEGGRWRDVTLYGVDHSPWVQGVRLALAHHKIPTRLTSYPLRLSWFLRRGLVFPALELADGTCHADSFRMYALLEDGGYPMGWQELDPAQRDEAQYELERLFFAYALGRCMPGKRRRFMKAWSRMQEEPVTALGVVWRALLASYFWVLIHVGRGALRGAGRDPYDLGRVQHRLAYWDARLAKQPWLTGEHPGFLDFALWGHVQSMASGLTDEVLPLIERQAHLMRWLGALTAMSEAGSPRYIDRLLGGDPQVDQASGRERALFWLALAGWWICWPVTTALILYGFAIRSLNPGRSGALMERVAAAGSRT